MTDWVECPVHGTQWGVCGECGGWVTIAAQYERNADYYRGLLVQIGEALGEAAYIADDGGRHEDVLCAKLPELVRARLGVKDDFFWFNEAKKLAAEVSRLKKEIAEHDTQLHEVRGLWYGACAARTEKAVAIARLRKRLDEVEP